MTEVETLIEEEAFDLIKVGPATYLLQHHPASLATAIIITPLECEQNPGGKLRELVRSRLRAAYLTLASVYADANGRVMS